jgi:hypothetical protein
MGAGSLFSTLPLARIGHWIGFNMGMLLESMSVAFGQANRLHETAGMLVLCERLRRQQRGSVRKMGKKQKGRNEKGFDPAHEMADLWAANVGRTPR